MLINRILAVVLIFYTVFISTSCNSGDDSAAAPVSAAIFTATINEVPFVATTATAAQNEGILTITGEAGNGEKVTIRLLAGSMGTHSGNMSYINEAGEEFINTDPSTMTNGLVTILSSDNNKVSGTFEFTGFSTVTGQPVEVKSGTFQNIPVTVPEIPVNIGTISALVDGTQTSFVEAYVAKADTNFILSGTNLSTLQILQINMPADIAPGTYAISGDPTGGIFAIINGDAGTVTSIQGTLTITLNSNGWLEGTFSFTGEDLEGNTIQITDGQFHAQIQE